MLHAGMKIKYTGNASHIEVTNFFGEPEKVEAEISKLHKNTAYGKREYNKKRHFVNKYSPLFSLFKYIDESLKTNPMFTIKGTMRVELCKDAVGYSLLPHIDIPEKFLTMQIYLGNESSCTSFHFSDGIVTPKWKHNCGYLMYEQDKIVHSLAPLTSDRYSVIINYVDESWKDTSQLLYG